MRPEHCFKTSRYHSHVTVCLWIYEEGEILGFIYDKNTRSYSSASKISRYCGIKLRFIKFSNAQKYLKASIKLQVTKLS